MNENFVKYMKKGEDTCAAIRASALYGGKYVCAVSPTMTESEDDPGDPTPIAEEWYCRVK